MEHTNLKKNMIWNAVGNLIYLGCQWLITVLVAHPRLGSFGEAGLLSVAMSMSATFQTLANFGIRNFQVSDIENKYTNDCYVFFRIVTCGTALLSCIAVSLISGYRSEQLLCIFLFMLFRTAEAFSDVLHGIAQKNDRLDIAGKSFAIKGIGLLICFLGGFVLFDRLALGLLAMTLFSCASTLTYDLWATRKLERFRFINTDRTWLTLAKETLPLCIYLFLSSALVMLPRLILERKTDGASLGIYASIFAPATLIQSAMGYIYNPFAQAFAQCRAKNDRRCFLLLAGKIILAIAFLAAVMIAAALLGGDFALKLLFGEAILPYTHLLIPILVAIAAVSVLGFLCMLAIVLRAFLPLLASCAIGFALCVAVTSPMIDAWDLNGTSYSLILSALVTCLILTVGILKKLFLQSKKN